MSNYKVFYGLFNKITNSDDSLSIEKLADEFYEINTTKNIKLIFHSNVNRDFLNEKIIPNLNYEALELLGKDEKLVFFILQRSLIDNQLAKEILDRLVKYIETLSFESQIEHFELFKKSIKFIDEEIYTDDFVDDLINKYPKLRLFLL